MMKSSATRSSERSAAISATGPGDLALVQMPLFETWRESNAGRDNLVEAYSRVGGVAGALAHMAEDVRKDKLSEDERKLLEAVLARLVALGDTGGATRRVASREEFDEQSATSQKS
jgi:hypothetical protein